jgi:hypothetical protein
MGDLQLLIAAYVFLRCLDICSRADAAYASEASRRTLQVVAALVACLALLIGVVSLGSGRRAAVTMPTQWEPSAAPIQRQRSSEEQRLLDQVGEKPGPSVEELLKRK